MRMNADRATMTVRLPRLCLAFLMASLLAGCSWPVMFRVEVDEPITGGKLTLNGKSAALMKNVDGAYWAKWNGSDAAGEVEVRYPDGSTATCQIGYVTHGMGIQTIQVRRRHCEWIE